jgi:hypothetical protein
VCNPADQEPSIVVVLPPPDVAASGPLSSAVAAQVGLGLVACDYTDAMTSAYRVL